MTRRRFFAPPEAFSVDGSVVTLAPEEARHLRDVLRLERGSEVFIFDGEGREFRCVIEESLGRGVTLRVSDEVEAARPESSLHLRLAVALLKGEKFDLVVQKATELGARRITPLLTKLADMRVRDKADAARRVARWQRIALEACKQSGRARVPQIDAPVPCQALIEGVTAVDACVWRVMFSERGGRGLIETVKSLEARPAEVTALVGSEGGWTDEEISLARSAGWSVVTLGGRTLRAETAAIAVAVLLQHAFGDLI
jgi:16S rRNA (uracil1498-N3)-methyltransferase